MYENRADHLRNNLRLQKIPVLIFFQFYLERNKKTITNSCRNNLWSKPISMLSKTEFKIHSNFRGVDEIKGLPISIDFQIQKHGVVSPV